MSDQFFQIIAILIYFAAMLAIGFYAYRKTSDHEGYMLAGRSLPPAVAALSAGASDMSGWLMMGLPGAIYLSGLIEGWIAIGLTLGAYLNWTFVAPRLRAYTEVAKNSITIPSFFENRLRDSSRLIRIASGIIILVFFTFYISSGMVAGGVFFESSFQLDVIPEQNAYLVGMLAVAIVTLAYTLFGGFLGASLTDVVQGLMMMLALLIVPVAAVISLGGFRATTEVILEVAPDHVQLLGAEGLTGATALAILSATAWGLGYFGQPHIIVRFMAMRDPAAATSARWIGMSWMILSMLGAVSGALVGVAYFAANDIDLGDPETVMLTLSQILLHPLVAGFILAAVLAAIMSTISSQLIVCSSALVEDLYRIFTPGDPDERLMLILGRGCVLAIGVIALVMAIVPNDSILGLVSFAWAGFGAAFGPAILLSLHWRRLTSWGALAGMVVGAVTVFAWSSFGPEAIYEIIPAFIAHIIVAVVVSLLTAADDPEIAEEFEEARRRAGTKAGSAI